VADRPVDQVLEPGPVDRLQVPRVPLYLGGLERDSLREHQTHPPASVVGLGPFQVPVPGDLLVARWFPVQHDRHVLCDELRLLVGRGVLEAGFVVVQADLLGVAFYLLVPGIVLGDTEQRPGVIRHQHRQRLGSPARRPDRPGVVDVDELAPVVVFEHLDPVDPLDRGGDDPLGQQRDRRPDRALYLSGAGVVVPDRPLDEVLDHRERRLLAGHLAFEFADPLGDPHDSQEFLDPVGHVPRRRDLDPRFRVPTLLAGPFCDGHRLVERGF